MTAIRTARSTARGAIERMLAFHGELVAVKRLAAAVGEDDPEADARVVEMFLRLRVAICPAGSPPPATDGIPDIGYVMAALADEALLHQVEWGGRTRWMASLMETSLYGSRVSGEELFALADGILDGKITGREDMAAAILLALALGFKGRWRDLDDQGRIDDVRRRLYEHVYRRPPPPRPDWDSVMPQGAVTVLEDEVAPRMPRASPWLAGVALSVIVALAASHWIWGAANAPILDLAVAILARGNLL